MLIGVALGLLTIYVASLLVGYATKYRKWLNISSKLTQMGPVHQIWGHLHLFSDGAEYWHVVLDLVQRTRTKMFTCWITFFYPVFVTCHPQTVKLLLKSSHQKNKYDPVGAYRLVIPWLGDGLLLSDGKKWERNRRLLTPAFHFDILRPYVQVYNDVADIFLEKLQKACDAAQSIEIYGPVSLATLDTMLRCSLSYNGDVQRTGENHPYVSAVKTLASLCVSRWVKPWLQNNFIYKLSSEGREFHKTCDFVHDFADKIINSRRNSLNENPSQLEKRRLDFLDILITAKDEFGKGLSDEDIRAEVDTFLFEGHDTTASAISWAIYCLAKYPKEQEIVYREIEEVLDGRAKLQWDDLSKLKKTTMFLKEVMRMHSPVPFISRWLTEPLTVEGVEIPANYGVDICIHAINHHPDVWPDHMEFIPTRFEDETKLDRDPYNYIPFSAGSRNCIGQNFALNEERVMIGALVKKFKVSLVEGHVYEELSEMVMRSKYGIKIHVQERKRSF